MKLLWEDQALADLRELAEWSQPRARAVVDAMEWMARVGFSLGRAVGEERYWPVPPLGVFYVIHQDVIYVTAVVDARRRRQAW